MKAHDYRNLPPYARFVRVFRRNTWYDGTLVAADAKGCDVVYRQRNGKTALVTVPAGRIKLGHNLREQMVKAHTAFDSFAELLTTTSVYRPTFARNEDVEIDMLAHTYNRMQEDRNDERRAFPNRTNWTKEVI